MEPISDYRKDLQQQSVNKQRQEHCQYENTYCERKMQDGIMGTDAEEDEREFQYKRDETEKRRSEMGTSQRETQAWQKNEREMDVVVDRKVDEQRQVAWDRNSAVAEKREKKIHQREEQAEKLGQILLTDAAATREQSDQIEQLQVRESLGRNVQYDIAERREADWCRREAERDRGGAASRRGQARADASCKELAEGEMELEDEEERAKTARNKQYKIDLSKQIDDNATRRMADHDFEQKRAQNEIDYDAARRSDVKEECKNKHDEEPVEKPMGYKGDLEVEESQANQVLINALYNNMEQKEFEDKPKMEPMSDYCKNLQQQMVNKQRQEHCQYENTYCERKMHDGIMGTDAEEDERELQYKRDETDKRRTEMWTSQREREARKENQKETNRVENRKIEEQRHLASDRSSAVTDERDRKILQREEQAEKLEHMLLADEVEESQANRGLINALYNNMEQKEWEDKPKMEPMSDYCKNLQQQMVNKQRQEHCQYENTYCERKMHDGIMGTDAEEDERELQYKRDETDKRRTEMWTSQRERETRKENQKEMNRVEDRKIKEQRHLASDRSSAVTDERDRKIHQRGEQAEKLGQMLLADATAIRERSDGIQLRQEQECFERNAQDDRAEIRREELYQEEAKLDREDVVRRRGQNSRRQTLEDAHYKEFAEEQMELEDEIEHQKELTKTARNKQYNIDLCKQIDDNARRRKAEHDLEQKRAQNECDYDEAWRSDVIEERRKLAEERVHKLQQAGEVDHDELLVERSGVYKEDLEGEMDSLAVSDRRHSFSQSRDQCRTERE